MTFVRRDLGDTAVIAWLRLPSLPAGIHGPFTRQLADRTAIAIAWGVGTGLYGVLIVVSADAFSKSLASLPQIEALISAIYPGIDLHQPSGLLQLAFYGFASFIVGLAGASFLAAWAGDENGGRLAVVMSAPITRIRWMLALRCRRLRRDRRPDDRPRGDHRGRRRDPGRGGRRRRSSASASWACRRWPSPGSGWPRAAWSARRWPRRSRPASSSPRSCWIPWAPPSKLPDPILQLSLFKHLGQPMAGIYDPCGIVVAVVLAVGGLAIGAWGLQRRDLDR